MEDTAFAPCVKRKKARPGERSGLGAGGRGQVLLREIVLASVPAAGNLFYSKGLIHCSRLMRSLDLPRAASTMSMTSWAM